MGYSVQKFLYFLANFDLEQVVESCEEKDTDEIINLLSKLAEDNYKERIKIVNKEKTVDLKFTFTKSEVECFLREFANYIRNANPD